MTYIATFGKIDNITNLNEMKMEINICGTEIENYI